MRDPAAHDVAYSNFEPLFNTYVRMLVIESEHLKLTIYSTNPLVATDDDRCWKIDVEGSVTLAEAEDDDVGFGFGHDERPNV